MKYKRFVYTPIALIVTLFELMAAHDKLNEIHKTYNSGTKLERIVSMWNKSSENFHQSTLHRGEETKSFEKPSFISEFSSEVQKCIEGHQNQITEDFVQGKQLIFNCFKATLILNMFRYLGESPKSSIKLFDGLLEFKRIPEKVSKECENEQEDCPEQYQRSFDKFSNKKSEYIKMYKKAMQKLINERKKFNAYRNQTEAEKADQLNRINQNSQAFLSEVIKTLGDEKMEEIEEEKLKKEMTDPKLLTLFDVLSKNYMLKFRFYPGVAGRMMRSHNGGFTFDVEIQDSGEEAEEAEEERSSEEGSTREIGNESQGKNYFDDYDGERTRSKSDKQKKKEIKKKAKKLKKLFPYLLLPMLIQMALLPFVFKKLFFLAMKALFAGKVALLLVGFNLLRNTCVNNDDFQKIRVEHYGYRQGEEYGAWIHGRSLGEPSMMAALSEEPFKGQKPQRSVSSS